MKWNVNGEIDRYEWNEVFTWWPERIGVYYFWLEPIERRWVECNEYVNCNCHGYWEYRSIK